MKILLATLAFAPLLTGATAASANHGPPPGASYEMREQYDQQHYAGQGRLPAPAKSGSAVTRGTDANNTKAQTDGRKRRYEPRTTSGHGDW